MHPLSVSDNEWQLLPAVIALYFVGNGWSRSDGMFPTLARHTELLAYARAGVTLAVVRLDRLGRSLAELLTIVEDLRRRGTALLSLEEKIDTTSAAGELVFHVFGAIAHFERRLILNEPRMGLLQLKPKASAPVVSRLTWAR